MRRPPAPRPDRAARTLLVLLALLAPLAAPAALAAPPVLFGSDLASEHAPGSRAEATFTIRASDLPDAEPLPEASVLFLNIVVPDASRGYPQAARRLFAEAVEEGADDMVGVVLTPADLREGRDMTVRFRFRDDAPPGDYVAILQLFRGTRTSPHRVRQDDRIAFHAFPFRVTREGEGEGEGEGAGAS